MGINVALLSKQIEGKFAGHMTDSIVKSYSTKFVEGTATLSDASRYTQMVSHRMSKALQEVLKPDLFPDGIDRDTARELLEPMLQSGYNSANWSANKVQESIWRKNGLGIKPQNADNFKETVENILDVIDDPNATISDAIGKKFESAVNRFFDNNTMNNAEMLHDLGFGVSVTRVYREYMRTTPSHASKNDATACDWCASRECDHISLKEAKQRDIWARHDGCNCEIIYETSKRVEKLSSKSKYWQS